jgi:hypothetical protein
MTDYRDWNITLTFNVPVGDTEGVVTEALFDAAADHVPADGVGLTARADTVEGKVWITFTLAHAAEDFAKDVATEMKERIRETVFSGDDACVTAA